MAPVSTTTRPQWVLGLTITLWLGAPGARAVGQTEAPPLLMRKYGFKASDT